ncbi:hypothetical protein [Actinotalea sp. K2]|uniref:hypothetical protein n=1 Tax=Actinotalea sp. K2 TaxID=2939438 RepID=UPI002016BB75|nr:hypothetical protein [Actinotalea sp. K2]MCL3862104.1 hypothetical protein [Actinotalea sp. K2]
MIAFRWLVLIIWPSFSVLSAVAVMRIWNSEEGSETTERNFQPVYDLWRLRARALGAGSMTLVVSLLVVPKEVVSLIHGGAPWEGGYSETVDNMSLAGVVGFLLFGLLWVTANFWGRPRWIIPPYLRPDRKRDRVD